MPPKAVFKGQTFAISGKLSQPRKEYEELIEKHGGAVAPTMTSAVTFMISTDEDMKARTVKVATAIGKGTPIVQEGFIGACIAAKKLLDPSFFKLKVAPLAKRKAAAASKDAAPAADAKKRKVVEHGPVATNPDVAVIAKSGLAEKAAVVQEEVAKGFVKGSLTWDVELVLNDPLKGKDKFYNIQLLASKAGGEFWTVQHWGRTGLEGTVHVDGPFDSIGSGKTSFRRKYRQKTGNVWGQLGSTFVETAGKYKLLAKAKDAKREAPGQWQYYLHNAVDGKKIGWYSYDEPSANNMEKYWQQFQHNDGLSVRFVQTNYFKYEIDFSEMIQTNTKSGTRRVIRRVPPGERPPGAAPDKIPEKAKPKVEDEEDDTDEEAEGSAADAEEDGDETVAEDDDVAEAKAAEHGRVAPDAVDEDADENAETLVLGMAPKARGA